jgi:CRP-like cAMP-binding protein/ActR/RegA family two-component response regulator
MELIARQPVVLLAEADALVGMDLSDALERSGYRVLGPFATSQEARAAMEQESPTLAIVDVVLRDGVCTALGRELRQRGVPFLVHSSLQKQDEAPASIFQGVPWLSKPALPEDVVVLLDELAFLPSVPMSSEVASPVALVRQAEGTANPLVRKLEGFTALSEADRALLERISAETRLVASHTDLVREGDKPDGVFLIMEGMACRHKHRASGARQIMAYLLPGDLCDLDVALLNRMDHTITTLSACQVVRIAPETVADVLQHHPQIARALRMSTLVDEATLREWLMNVGRRTATERIAHLFCELLVRLRAVGLVTENSYALPLTQADLADTTGLSTVHVNRSLQELRRQGLIELKNRHLTILNLPRLRAVGEFQANYLHLGDRIAA